MNSQTNYKQRTYLDPIHGPIKLNLTDPIDYLLSQIIDTKEFQRLRRIRQMGSGWFTFHGAEHTRFGHSLGTLFTAKKMITHLANHYEDINNHKTTILVSALIHDIGHGPFSHTSEKFINSTHEEWTKRIILEDSEISTLLKSHDKNLPDSIVKTMDYKNKNLYVSQLISSYIDCDRLDYLHRDSYFVGVPYGLTGSDRIISSLEINTNGSRSEITLPLPSPLLVVNEGIGIDAVVHYLQARHSMYQQVYQHKKNLACDFLLKKIIERVKVVNPKNISRDLIEWLNFENKPIEKINLNSYLQIDDFCLISNIQNWSNDDSFDKILSDLSNRFISRRLFKSLEFRMEVSNEKINETLEKTKQMGKSKGFINDYYIGIEQSSSKPYEPYQVSENENKTGKAIYIKQQNGQVKELSEISGLVKALSKENIIKTCLIYTPELKDEVTNLKGFNELFK